MRFNPGWFRPGHDPRRHSLTRAECACGGIIAQTLLRLVAADAYFQTDEELNEYLYRQRLRLTELGFAAKSFRLTLLAGGHARV